MSGLAFRPAVFQCAQDLLSGLGLMDDFINGVGEFCQGNSRVKMKCIAGM